MGGHITNFCWGGKLPYHLPGGWCLPIVQYNLKKVMDPRDEGHPIKVLSHHQIPRSLGNQSNKRQQESTRSCYHTDLPSSADGASKFSHVKELEEMNIERDHAKRMTFISAEHKLERRVSLVWFLIEHQDQFMWSHEDMIGIDLKLITYYLKFDPTCMPIQQKRFPKEKIQAINNEDKSCWALVQFGKLSIEGGWTTSLLSRRKMESIRFMLTT